MMQAETRLKRRPLIAQLTRQATTTLYTGAFVYNNDTLQFIGNEEGRRVRPKLINPSLGYTGTNIQYVYDFFIKDHLGNVRMVLTEETPA
jgi:cation transport regulator ChaC